jgi:hypothetical protein
MEIPKQLQNENFRFCKIKDGTKAPEEKAWQSWNNYFYYNEEFKKDRDAYGVVCGIGKLYVIDFDEQQIQEELLIKLPTTFTVKTGGKGLYHLYFTDNSKLPLSYQINNKENKRVLDIQGNGKQVIGVNSKHAETKKLYEVINDIPIAEFPQQELLQLLEQLDFKYNLCGGSGSGTNARLTQCKFHDDHDPSMAIYQDNGTFYCFGCRAYGFLEVLNYKGEPKKKETKNGTFYYIEKEDIEKFMKHFVNEESIIPEDNNINFKEIYEELNNIFRYWCDLREELYIIIPIWVIGTYFHKQFPTYPYLFFNACKGSGKTRLLKLIASLSYKGKVLNNLSEASVFRTASDRTFCIDEFERVGSKEKAVLRELLNSAYKKGISVERTIKKKTKMEEKYEIESFDLYCPIALANIWGMEEVLSDRCIAGILEKSDKKEITRLVETFDINLEIQQIKQKMVTQVPLFPQVTQKEYTHILTKWNSTIRGTEALESLESLESQESQESLNFIFNKIKESNLEGRYLELWFPLLILANKCEIFDKMLEIAQNMVILRKEEDISESRDIALLEFISKLEPTDNFISIRKITQEFKEQEELEWISPDWVGRALKRLVLIKQKRKVSKGREVILDYEKAMQKIKMFKPFEKTEPKQEELKKEYQEELVEDEPQY